jgi:hypothetical protein
MPSTLTPEPGWYAISATGRRLGTLWGDYDLYAFFRIRTDRSGRIFDRVV